MDQEHPLARFRFHLQFKPRFSDLDAFGHVNHTRFFTYFEEGRVAYMRHLGIFIPPNSQLSIVLQRAECQYLAPVHHHHLVEVHLCTSDWGRKSFSFHYAIWLPEEDILAAKGHTRAVSFHVGNRKPTDIPEDYLRAMQGFEAGEWERHGEDEGQISEA